MFAVQNKVYTNAKAGLCPRINGSLTPRRRQRGVKQHGIRVIGAAIMTRDAGKCYIEFKETGRNLSYSNVARFDAHSLLSVVRPG